MADISKITLPNNNQYDIKDNVAREQIENLNTDLKTCPVVTDLNDATENGMTYRFNTGALNNPGYNYGLVHVWQEGNNIVQIATQRGGTAIQSIQVRSRSSTSTWGNWIILPTRAEVDKLNTDINSHTVAITDAIIPLYATKVGAILFIRALYVNPTTNIAAGAWTTIGILPDGYRPLSQTQYIGGTFTDSAAAVYGFRGQVTTSGVLAGQFDKNVTTSTSLFGTIITFIRTN